MANNEIYGNPFGTFVKTAHDNGPLFVQVYCKLI